MSDAAPAAPSAPEQNRNYPCPGCGANLAFEPKAQKLECPYCGFEQPIPQSAEEVDEKSFEKYLVDDKAARGKIGEKELRCNGCGAITTTTKLAQTCPFCGAAQVVLVDATEMITPGAVLPFKIPQDDALVRMRKWLTSLWFAPSELKQLAANEGIRGVYVPHWTYDAYTRTFYSGLRGEHYWVTETYSTTENGKSVTRTRQVQKTRWYPAAGRVERGFDDVLVPAVKHLPASELEQLEPWDLRALLPYEPSYLAGYEAGRYEVDLRAGFGIAQGIMEPVIRGDCCRDIGGDVQQVTSMRTSYSAVTFKHLLLPVWVAAYRFRNKVYRVLVNARTGEVKGERPWSAWKIFGVVLLVAIVITIIVLLANRNG